MTVYINGVEILDASQITSVVEAAGIALATGKRINVISALTANQTWSGLTATLTAGQEVTIGQACYMESDGKMWKALATAVGTMPVVALATGTIAADAEGEFLLIGYFREDTVFDFTAGDMLYASEDTAGALKNAAPTTFTEQVQICGKCFPSAHIIFFCPNLELVEIMAEILRPRAAGDECQISGEEGAVCPNHYLNVEEDPHDGDLTFVSSDADNPEEDLYNLPSHNVGSGTIDYVKVYMVCKATGTPSQPSAYIHIKTGGGEYNGTFEILTTGYATYSFQWDISPKWSADWTWDEIDALQIGVGIRKPADGETTRCTQVYVEVGYTPAG